MKQINLRDKDYDSLMALCKELQTQENDGQAHPYFWEPMSEKYQQDPNEEGDIMFHHDCENYTPKELWEDDSYRNMKDDFLEEFCDNGNLSTYKDLEDEWIDFIESDMDFTKWYRKLEDESEHNPSLFKSDVKDFIKGNKHHLGQKPHTFARTIWRMPRMINLISILCRINKQENADNEIKRRCHTPTT